MKNKELIAHLLAIPSWMHVVRNLCSQSVSDIKTQDLKLAGLLRRVDDAMTDVIGYCEEKVGKHDN